MGARMPRWVFIAGASLLLSACAFLTRALSGGVDHIRFSHERHEKRKIECIVCHEIAYDATTLEASLRPAEKVCMQCHGEEKDKGRCGFCHGDVDARSRAAPARQVSIKMSHADHIERVEEDCRRCHITLPEFTAPARPPPMSACFGCHEHQAQFDQGLCTTCHVDLTRYPLKPLSLFTHQGDFLRSHGPAARTAANSCATCHEQRFCSDCHARTAPTRVELLLPERVDREMVHRGDWISRHPLEARADAATCQRCHSQSTCESCHTAQNLTSRGDNPRNPHPPNWAFPGPGTILHGQEARRNIASCAACHDRGAASICVDCHRVGGVGGTPHPPGWSLRHPPEEIQRNGMCLACHL